MKKLIGIILAVCMLSTVAFAGTATYSNEVADMETMTVTVNYGGIAEGAQATLLAYDVTGVEGATAATAYVDEETTPIKGIDQEPVDGTFSFKVADTYRGTLVVKIGGTDVDPVAFTVEFADSEDPVTPVVVYAGDVNNDGKVNGTDASLIKVYAKKLTASQKNTFNTQNSSICGKEYTLSSDNTSKYYAGDVNNDGKVNGTDASLIQVYAKKLTASQKNAFNTANSSNCGAEVNTVPES